MSSSKKSESQFVHLKSISGPIEIRLLNKNLRTVDIGYGELKQKVEPGIYLIKLDSGTDTEDRFITIEPDKGYQDLELSIPIRSAAPLSGIIPIDNPQMAALSRLSLEPTISYGSGGRLMVFVRNHEEYLKNRIDLSNLSIRDEKMNPVCHLAKNAKKNQSEGWTCLSANVDPGGYMLNWKDKRHFIWASVQKSGNIVDQSIWIQSGWITAIFLATNPRKNGIPRMTGMTIHMRPMSVGFEAQAEEKEMHINQAQEVALTGLRSGDARIPIGLQNLLLEEKFRNPMLGIIGAHALLLEYNPKWSVFDQVVRNLDKIIPNHPDIIALRLMGKLRRDIKSQTYTQAVNWPPMMYEAYRGLINRDWDERGLVEAGSMADIASSRLLPQGPWTVWASIDEAIAREKKHISKTVPYFRNMKKILSVIETEQQYTRGIPEPSGEKEEIPVYADPAVDRVIESLQQLKDSKTCFSPEHAVQQLKNIGLPVAAVERVLRILSDQEK